MRQNALLSLQNITKSFVLGEQAVQVLHGIDLTIYQGEMVAIVGQSGSGKSTLMNIMALLDTPSQGLYSIDGTLVQNLDNDDKAILRRDRFGFIFQRYQLLPSLRALDNVAMPAIYAGTPKHERTMRAGQLLRQLGLSAHLAHYPSQLSGGQQQRVSIARALMNGGQIIFADEPTGALDSKSSAQVMQILQDLHKAGHTIILVTHDEKIAQSAPRIIKIGDGRILHDSGTPNIDLPSENTKTTKTKIANMQVVNTQITNTHDENVKIKSINIENTDINHENLRNTDVYGELPTIKNHHTTTLGGFKEAFLMAIITMRANKMRTLLTMLGIIIGIASVVLIVGLGNGTKQKVLKDINSMGAPTLTVMAGSEAQKGRIVDSLTLQDMLFLESQSFVASASPDLSATMSAQALGKNHAITVDGVSTAHDRVQNVRFVAGKMFGKDALDTFKQHIVISEKTATTLFVQKDKALGQIIMLDGVPSVVVGVFAYQGIEGDYDRGLKAWLPYTTFRARFVGESRLASFTLLLKQNQSSALAVKSVEKMLTMRHGEKDFTIFNSDSLAKAVEKTAGTLTLLVGAIALISLLVGGIGVMNIMLVSVSERTGEIGVRMAVGARYGDIVQQFLIEAMVVCMLGGVLGVALAFMLGFIINSFGVAIAFSTVSVLVSVAFACVIGLLFGLMPAHKAAKLSPIEALA